MFAGLAIALIPLFFGYLIKTKKYLFIINQLVILLLYIILFMMGYNLGQLEDIAQTLPKIAYSAFIFSLIIHLCNIVGLIIYDKLEPQPVKKAVFQLSSRWRLLFDSFKLCSMVVIGFFVGLFTKHLFLLPLNVSTYILVILIFLVGVQLRNTGISLMNVFFNKRGIYTAMIMIVTSLLAGIISAIVLNLPISQGLAIASGFGWYSLSSVMINDAWGAVFGSIAFFNDLLREIFCLFLIPLFMPYFRSTAVGIAGATALDCTLPVIQRSGGMEVVPLAISFGFITNIVSPILLAVFSSISIH